METKIAFVTDDHKTISAHFGRATFYEVFTLEDGKVTRREARPKPGHNQFAAGPHEEEPGHAHGTGPAAEGRHLRMAGVILDCQVLVARGMGQGAFDNLQRQGIQPLLTEIGEIEAALEAYRDGRLIDRPERLH